MRTIHPRLAWAEHVLYSIITCTEGLGSVIGLQRGRKQSMEDFLTVVLLWLHQGGTGFAQDRYLQELLTDSQTIA